MKTLMQIMINKLEKSMNKALYKKTFPYSKKSNRKENKAKSQMKFSMKNIYLRQKSKPYVQKKLRWFEDTQPQSDVVKELYHDMKKILDPKKIKKLKIRKINTLRMINALKKYKHSRLKTEHVLIDKVEEKKIKESEKERQEAGSQTYRIKTNILQNHNSIIDYYQNNPPKPTLNENLRREDSLGDLEINNVNETSVSDPSQMTKEIIGSHQGSQNCSFIKLSNTKRTTPRYSKIRQNEGETPTTLDFRIGNALFINNLSKENKRKMASSIMSGNKTVRINSSKKNRRL